jgi:hypothetical protein
MTYRVISKGEIESIKVPAADKRGAPLTGKTDLYVRIQRSSDNWFLDWADDTFKAAGHTTLNALLTEIDATNAAGLYELSGRFDSGAVTNLATIEDLNIIPVQTPGTDAILPDPVELQVRPVSIAQVQLGARQITITIQDDGAIPLPGANIDIYDASNTTFLARKTTDSSAQAVFALDDGTYSVRIYKQGYSFTIPEILVVSGDASVTYQGIAFVAPTPSAPELCVIFGTLHDALGNPISGACVEAYAITPQVVSGIQKGDRIGTTVTDADGFFQIELVRNTVVQFAIEGTAFNFERTVPDLASQDVSTWT